MSRRFLPLWLAGLAGIAALLLLPPPVDLAARVPPQLAQAPVLMRLLPLGGPALLVTLAAFAGAALAHRVGLASVLAGTATRAGWRVLAGSASLGLTLGVLLASADRALLPWLGDDWSRVVSASAPDGRSLAVGVLYGGLAEEIMMRWGLQAALAWAAMRVACAFLGAGARDHASAIAATAIALAALAFAAAHLPAVAAAIEPTPAIVARTLVLNGIAGAAYGTLFHRHGLEAAISAHAATHVGLHAVRIVTGAT